MTGEKCQETSSSCVKCQAGICLHCNRRLCVTHIIEHDKIVFDDVDKLYNLAEKVLRQIKEISEKCRSTCDDLLPSLNEWRTQQLENLEQIYDNEIQFIELQEKALDIFYNELLKKLEDNARQPLERIQKQQNANSELLNLIRQTIEKVREESVGLKWNYSISSTIDLSDATPIIDDKKLIVNQSKTNPKSSAENIVQLRNGRALKRLVHMFANVSSIEQAKIDLDKYYHNQGRFFKLPILVTSYLKAWYMTSKASGQTVLYEHILTIQKYLKLSNTDFDILVGIQVFFFNENIRQNKEILMKFLLEFFLDYKCINQSMIIDWYNNDNAHNYKGYPEAKELVHSFLQSLVIDDTTSS